MKLNKRHKYVLYALVKYLEQANRRVKKRLLKVSVSKIVFINVLKGLKIIEKSQRALYKNLEVLEKKKLIKYDNKYLRMTERGMKMVEEIENEMKPYREIARNVRKKELLKLSKAPQAFFSS